MATTGLGVFNDTLFLLYASYRDGNWEVYYKMFNDIEWSSDVRVTYNPAKDGWAHLISYENRHI
jgi:major membrane immunogen (membrane-anchored lipoprotein)